MVEIDASYKGDGVEVLEFEAKFKSAPANGRVVIYKVEKDTKKPIKGMKFELRDKNEKVLETLETDKKGYNESKEYVIGSYENGKFKNRLSIL